MTRNRAPYILISSNFSGQCSDQIALAATPMVVVTLLGQGPAETGVVQLFQTLPFLALSLPLGLAVDRYSRKNLMLIAEVLRATAISGTVVALLSNTLSVTLLAMLGFLGAVGTVAFSIAGQALLPSLVSREQFPSVNRRLELGRSVALVAGPLLAGVLLAHTGAPVVFATAALASITAFVLLSQVREAAQPMLVRGHIGRNVVEGLQFVFRHKLLRPIATTAIIFNVGWFLLQTVLVAFLIDQLGSDTFTVGLLLGLYGVGMMVGALSSSVLSKALSLGSLIVFGPLCGFIGSLFVLVSWATQNQAWIGIALFLFGFGPILWSISTTSLRQVVTPPNMQGRVSAVLTLATYGARPVGAGVGIAIVTHFGVGPCLATAALCFCGQLAIIMMSPPSRLRDFPVVGTD